MNPFDKQFHHQQRRLRAQGSKPGVKAESVVRPLFQPELTNEKPKSNTQRLVDYMQKIANLEVA